MAEKGQTSRRDFLATSAKVAGLAGLAATGGCSATSGPALTVTAGPEPPSITPGTSIRLGFIGVGSRANALLDRAMAQKNATIKAIVDPDDTNRNKTLSKLQKKWNIEPDVYTGPKDYLKLLARDDIDAVMSAVPCNSHAEIYLACFAAGKHFYGEKPMCIAVNEADAIVEAQKKNPNVICQIGFQRRGSSYYQEAIKRIHDGMIDTPFEALGAWRISGGPLGMPDQGTRVWFGRKAMSGDWMLEQACHTWDVMCWVAGGPPVVASGRGRRDLFKAEDPERDVTDFYVAHVEFPNRMILDFEHNWRCPQHDDQFRFRGIFERFTGLKGGIALAEWPSECRYYPRDPREKPVEIASTKPNATHQAVDAFFNSLRTGTPPVSSVHNGRMATLTGLLVRKAVYENRRVEMKEIL